MTDTSKPDPLFSVPHRPVCPVCGQTSYSRAGIHPQCAQKQADDKQAAIIKAQNAAAKLSAPEKPPTVTLKAWHKPCPRCRRQVHVRSIACPCGYSFTRSARSGAG